MSASLIDPKSLPERVSYEVAAVYLGIGYSTVRRWVSEGRLPRPLQFGRQPFFRREDILAVSEVPLTAGTNDPLADRAGSI